MTDFNGNALRLYRRVNKLTQSDLVNELKRVFNIDTSLYCISSIENGHTNPKIEVALGISLYFNISLDYLYCVNDKREINKSIFSIQNPWDPNINELKYHLESFPKRFHALRKEHNLKRAKLSEILVNKYGYKSQHDIYLIENKLEIPSLKKVIDFADFFSVSLDYLFGLSNMRINIRNKST